MLALHLICLLLLSLPVTTLAARRPTGNYQQNIVASQETLGVFQKIPDLSDEQIAYGNQVIPQLNYNAQRLLRKICALPGVNFQAAQQAINRLQQERFTFDQVKTYEALAGLSTMDINSGLRALDTVKGLYFETSRAFRAYTEIEGVTARQCVDMLPVLGNMSSRNARAATAFFHIKGLNADDAMRVLPTIIRLRGNQPKAAENLAKIPDMQINSMVQGLNLLVRIDQDNALKAGCLFTNKAINADEALQWLGGYFSLSTSAQEAQYNRLSADAKTVLLKALYEAASDLLWKINNLHAITDANGYEISVGTLSGWSMGQLQAKYDQLQPSVRARFGSLGSRGGAIETLRRATAAARVQTARDLSVADAYAMMAQGSDLYDSSFRDILVPVMLGRINDLYHGDLLLFLQSVDPGNILVSDFISSCAQKGKLTEFFPTDPERQKAILKLVGSSALQNEDSILLFSATFSHLLKVLTPSARTYLISLMAQQGDSEDASYAKLINVILQYYLQTYPELLGADDRIIISRVLVRHGTVDLSRYQDTPFVEWLQDHRLASVSMYHPDDDGRTSFVSNANMLMGAGYQLVVSDTYTPAGERGAAASWIHSGLASLFQAMRSRHFAVAFVKTINGVRIVHTQFVYSGMENQMDMLNRFIHSGDEMLAQRGHSYWRSEQIVEPLQKLIQNGEVTDQDLRAKQRFLSLGSCGGVKVYTNLTRLFDSSVDILATIGTGLAMINDPYNKIFFEIIASNGPYITWKDVAQRASSVFRGERGQDYIQPGSLTSILHKILDEEERESGQKRPHNWFQQRRM